MAKEERGRKDMDGKLRFDLIPPESMIEVAKVYTDGALKYGDNNWRKGIPANELVGAIERHVARFKMGQEINPTTGTHEMAHVVFSALAIISQYYRGVYPPEPIKIADEHKKVAEFMKS